jgi:prepilin-type N-terminal cleavage/methylation domain-containing protein
MSARNRQKGFTMIELLIVLGIIAILTAILVPNLLKSRKGANEKAVMSTMKSVSGAQAIYYMESNGRFGTLDQLEAGNYLGLGVSNRVSTGGMITGFQKESYQWTYAMGAPRTTWSLAASPLAWDTDGSRHFFMNETNVIRYSAVQGTVAGPGSPAIE